MKGVLVANEYKKTMNLPKTAFPMRAGLAKSEPVRLKGWQDNHVYEQLMKKNEGHDKFVLHDGPPYANGPIHLGHAMNKISKDIINRYRSMQGYQTPYVPGWDCHGQPIEHKVEEMLGTEKFNQTPVDKIRELCNKFAVENIDLQREGFKRLGVLGDWDNPYLTLYHQHDAADIEVFKEMFDAGMIYRGHKPVHWCKHCHTALAEAEIEYGDEPSPSIYVRFELTSKPAGLENFDGPVDFVIWTTTPWTIPSDQAVSLKPEAIYIAVEHEGRAEIMMKSLAEQVCEIAGWEYSPVMVDGKPYEVPAETFDHLHYKQPAFDGVEGVALLADYVGTEDGTGIVHNSPGHGVDDYYVCLKEGMDICMPVDDDGRFYVGEDFGTGGPFSGMDTDEANPHIIEFLRERGTLVAEKKITHSYPHCWRCKNPVLFRATDQWFVSMDKTGLRETALDQVKNHVAWYPEHASNRIGAMVEQRPDWCISRQRNWGVPIPSYTCADCGEKIMHDDTLDAVIRLFHEKGSDAWFTDTPESYLGDACVCPKCGGHHLKADRDILDVWWDSGVSWKAVCEFRPELKYPADVYLEGSDQHRGWFQSSLLTSIGAYGVPPYRSVMHCGFTVDEEGRKMSKSLGNGIDPLEMAEKYGADALRFNLITGNSPGNDMRFYVEKCEAMRNFCNKIWNASRFVMMNLTIDHVELPKKLELEDKWILSKLNTLIREVTDNMDAFELGVASAKIYDFIWDNYCDWFIELTKNRLNSDDQTTRENAQNVLCYVLIETLKLLHPFMPFITEEIWQALPHEGEFLMLSKWPEYNEKFSFPAEEEAMQTVIEAITAIRARRNEMNVAPSKKVHYTVATAHADTFSAGIPFFTRLASASDVTIVPANAAIDADGKVEVDTHAARIFMPLAELVDFEKELARIAKEKANAEKQLAGIENKLKNEGFLAKAPEAVINGARADAEKLKALIEKLDASAAAMKK